MTVRLSVRDEDVKVLADVLMWAADTLRERADEAEEDDALGDEDEFATVLRRQANVAARYERRCRPRHMNE